MCLWPLFVGQNVHHICKCALGHPFRGQRVKDDAYVCYCAYILCILSYSGCLWVVPTNKGIVLRGLKLGRKQNLASTLAF